MIYIGNFLHMTNQQAAMEVDRRHGEFHLIVEAEDNEMAILMFKDEIIAMRESTDFFEGDSKIYFNQLLEFETISKTKAAMVNFKSIAGDPVMPFIGCTLPNEAANDCRIFSWDKNQPEIDGEKERAFIEFKA